MSNDKTTVADVQPGGRVRLATVLYDRAHDLLADAYNAGTHGIGYSQQAMELHDAIIPAQPSPGGQGDALAIALEVFERRRADIPYEVYEQVKAVCAALAARQPVGLAAATQLCEGSTNQPTPEGWEDYWCERQPVGEPVGYLFTDDPAVYAMPGSGFHSGAEPPKNAINVVPLYAAPPAQQPAQVYLDGMDRALGEAIDQRDRYHDMADDLAGHIAAITGADIGEHSSANCPWQNAIEAAEEYKAAQAVDLEPRPMNTAPRDGTMVRLLVLFDDHATEDKNGPAWTIGANTFQANGENLWQFAGWCWTHDHFTEGKGTPVGWLPLTGAAQAMDLAPTMIPDTPEVRDILGRPNFWCSPWANVLRRRGDVIPCKAEEEQAAVIRFMLNHYLAHGARWAEAAEAEIQAIRYQVMRND